jgi:regulator of protease activity HflC (stomatin/prohibitin superfamily)
MSGVLIVLVLLVLAGMFLTAAVKVAREYERGVVFRLGRLIGLKGPGLFILVPFIDKAVKVDLRTVTLNVPPQEVITRDNVTVKVNAVAYFRVIDANRAIVQVENYLVATSQIAQTTLRSVLGQVDLDQLLSERDQINDRLQAIIDEQTEPWGVKVSVVEVKDVELPQSMQRALARQAEAERERRAKIIAAEGEFQASEKLSQAARVIASEPAAIQLRYLQTVNEVGSSDRNSTLILPFPIEMLQMWQRAGSPVPQTNHTGDGVK